jgi:hypothetical protein
MGSKFLLENLKREIISETLYSYCDLFIDAINSSDCTVTNFGVGGIIILKFTVKK